MTVKKIYIGLNDEELDFIKHLASMHDLTVDSMLIALCKDKIADELALKRDLEKKTGTHKKIVAYRGHVIRYDTELQVYKVAIKRDGTDTCYSTLDDAYNAIDDLYDWR